MRSSQAQAYGIQGANRYALFTNNATAQIELQLPVWGPAAQSTTGAHTGADAAIHTQFWIDMNFACGTGDF